MELLDKIKTKKAKVGIIGLGYVGLPLALEFAKTGFNVVGIDVDKGKTEMVNRGESYILDVPQNELKDVVTNGRLRATVDFNVLREVDTINICVPTPLRKSKEPDISFIVSATKQISKYLHPGQLIILESTTYPGTTEEVILPVLEAEGLKVGKDFYLAFSPERVDPGNLQYTTKNIPKVVGGVTKSCNEVAKALYEQALDKVFSVSSPKVAEMVKLLENTFRSVNIGLVNEIALMSEKLGVDVWEVIDAAGTKPFGFLPFYPGPGLGGHCIPIDPFYLSWKARLNGFEAKFIELAGEINRSMPEYVVKLISDALNNKEKSVKGSKILILGVAYKRDVSDVRESPALEIIKILNNKGAELIYNDSFVPTIEKNGVKLTSTRLNEELLGSVDCAVIVTDHKDYDYQWIVDNARLVIDTRNATKNVEKNREKIVKL